MYVIFYIFLICFVLIHVSLQNPIVTESSECFLQRSTSGESVKVFLTISSLYVSTTEDGVVKRQLEINWDRGNPAFEDVISVYNSDPTSDTTPHPILSIQPYKYPGAFFRSNITIPVILLNASHLSQDHCLGYWAAYKNAQGDIISFTCLRIQPFWMEENEKYLAHLKLNQVMIPGSHDSGSFYYHKEDGPLSKYKYAQEENIFSQMMYGLRYFDLRVGYYKKNKDKYYINHNFLRTDHSVKSVLLQVLKYIKSTRKEIVILDFHNFPIGFTSNHIHGKLIMMIEKILGPYLIPNSEKFKDATFCSLWKHNKRVLVSYDSETREHYSHNLLWPNITRAWGNKQNPEDLKSYFEDVFEKPVPNNLWASMAELTPNARTIFLHPETGLRVLADKINRNVTQWFRDHFWHKANIVATDYFLGNDIIDVAIRANRIKGACPENFWPMMKP